MPSPTPRRYPAAASDPVRGVVVLHGGQATGGHNDETWEWDGADWTQRTPAASPGGRYDHAMSYDKARAEVVMFGGHGAGGLPIGDTWVWDGTNWEERTPATSPTARRGHATAYDAIRERVVLFGGQLESGSYGADTWEWDGVTWTEIVATGPVARAGHSLIYDPLRRRIVLHGGTFGLALGDDWEWDGSVWTPVPVEAAGPDRGDHAAAYDAARALTIAIGGTTSFSSAVPIADTWTLRWGDAGGDDECAYALDRDGDGDAGCDDAECWPHCAPGCPPGASCGP